MPLIAIGVSHQSVGVEELATLLPLAPELGERVAAHPAVRGALVLATCNRFEVYLDSALFHEGVEVTLGTLRELAGQAGTPTIPDMEILVGQGAIAHALAVTSGLESMVLGECEIAGQVRSAMSAAQGHLSPPLHRLFQHALATSKTVASRTRLSEAGRSVASVALDLAQARHGEVASRRILVVGTGAFARVVVADLVRRGCTDIWVHSETGRAAAFARTHPVQAVPDDGLADAVARAELVITCSGGERALLTEDLLTGARFGVAGLLPVIDLSLGRDVAREVATIPGVDVIDLEAVGEFAPTTAAPAVLAARALVDQAVETFLHLEGGRAADPAVVAMRSHIMGIISAELDVVTRKYPPEVAEAVAHSLRRVSNELMHTPSLRAQELARSGGLDDYRRAMRTLFGIDVAPVDTAVVG